MPRKTYVNSAVEAARITGLSEKTIRRKLDSGELQAEKTSTGYQIRIADLRKLTERRKPADLDALASRMQELEEIQADQALTIDAQAAQIEAKAIRISDLEQRVSDLEDHLKALEERPAPTVPQPVTGQLPEAKPATKAPTPTPAISQDKDRTMTTSLLTSADLEPGSILVAHFARNHGLNQRTITDQVRTGKISATSIDKGGRPEHWLSPGQQAALIEYWQAEGRKFTPCPDCPHSL
jgi:excisionase family DNA binding protein